MNFTTILRLIWKNNRLAEKRNPMFDKNRFAKGAFYFFLIYWAALFLLYGVMLPSVLSESNIATEPYHILNCYLIYFLIADFLFRWFIPTDYQDISRYYTLPIKRSYLVHAFLIDKLAGKGKLFWLAFFIPFALRSLHYYYGWSGTIGYSIGIYLLFLLNSQWFLCTRLLSEKKFFYTLLPLILVYGGLAALEFLDTQQMVSHFTVDLGEGFMEWNLFYFTLPVILIVLLYVINFKLMKSLTYQYGSENKKTGAGKLSRFTIARGNGNFSQYVNLNIRMMTRTKYNRRSMIMSIGFAAVFWGMLLGFHDFTNYLTGIGFTFYFLSIGVFNMSQLQLNFSMESTFMDGLMVQPLSLKQYIRAKYLLHVAITVFLSLVLFVVCAIKGIDLLLPFAVLFFNIGGYFPIVLFFSRFNTTRLELNGSMMQKNKNQKWTNFVFAILIYLPTYISGILQIFLEESSIFIAFIIGGLAVFLLHPLWIDAIVRKWTQKKYYNLEQFRKKA